MREVLEDIQIRVWRSYVKIPVIFLVPALMLTTLYIALYFFLNSNVALITLEKVLKEALNAEISVADMVVGGSLTEVTLYGAVLGDAVARAQGERRPVITVDRIQAKLGPLALLSKTVHLTRVHVHGANVRMHYDKDAGGQINLLRALGLYSPEESPNQGEDTGPPVSLNFEDISILESTYSFDIEETVDITLPRVEVTGGALSVDESGVIIQVERLKTQGSLTYPPTLFGFPQERGPWVVHVDAFEVGGWRWINEGFVAGSIKALVEGYTLEGRGEMAFPESEDVLRYNGAVELGIPIWSPLIEYFVQDAVQVAAPSVKVQGRGTLGWVRNRVEVLADLVQVAGLKARDLRARVDWVDDVLEVEEGRFWMYGGQVRIESAFFSLFRQVYGGTLSFRDVDPAAMLRDLEVEAPFLAGAASGRIEATGQVPASQEYDPFGHRLLANATDRWITATTLEPLVLQRAFPTLLLPARTVTLAPQAEVWVDLDRIVMPQGTLLLDGRDRIQIKDFSLRYDTMELEPRVGDWGVTLEAQLRDLAPYFRLQGLWGVDSDPVRVSLRARGPLLAPQASVRIDGGGVRAGGKTLITKAGLGLELDAVGKVRLNSSVQTPAGSTSIRGSLWPLALGREPGSGRPAFGPKKDMPLEMEFDAKGVDVKAGLLLAGLSDLPISGTLDLQASARGTTLNPALCVQLTGSKMEIFGEPVGRVVFEGGYSRPGSLPGCVEGVRGLGTAAPHLWVNTLQLTHRDAGEVSLSGAFVPQEGAYSFALNSRGFRPGLTQALIDAGVALSGRVDLALHGTGSLQQPDISGSVRTEAMVLDGLELGQLALALHTLDTPQEHVLAVAGRLHPWLSLEAQIPFDQELPMSARAPLYASVGFDSLDLFRLLGETNIWERFALFEGLGDVKKLDRALISGRVEFFVPQSLDGFQVLATLPTLRIGPSRLRLSNREEIRVGYTTQGEENGLLTIEHFDIGALGKHITVRGSVDPKVNFLDLEVDGALRLEMLETLGQIFAEGVLDQVLEASGEVEVEATLRGAPPQMEVEGALVWKPSRVRLRALEEPIAIRSGALSLTNDQVVIPKETPLNGEVLGGVFTLSGALGLQELAPKSLSLDLWTHNIRYSVPEVANVTLDTQLAFRAGDLEDFDTWIIEGTIDLLDGLFYQSINVLERAVTGRLIGLFNRRTEVYETGLLETYPQLREVEFDVRLRARDGFRIKNLVERFTLDLEVRLDLAITQSLALPRIAGSVEVLEGNVLFQGERFQVKTGLMRFEGDASRPYFDVVAVADIRNACRENALSNQFNSNLSLNGAIVTGNEQDDEIYRISLNVQGYPDTLNILYESIPFANQRDILSLLFTGCTVDLLTASSASQPTLETLFGSFIGQLERQIQDAISVEEFNIVPGVERTQVRISDSLTRRLSWRFQLDRTFDEFSGTGQFAQFEYQLTDRLKGLISESSFSDVNTSNRIQLDLKLKYRLPLD